MIQLRILGMQNKISKTKHDYRHIIIVIHKP